MAPNLDDDDDDNDEDDDDDDDGDSHELTLCDEHPTRQSIGHF